MSPLTAGGEIRLASTDTVVVVETLVFSVEQNTLLWAGVTESTNPKHAGRLIKDVVIGTVREMTKQGLVRRT